jgi:hypothetical protein
MSTPELTPVAFETRHGTTVVKSMIAPWKLDTPDTFSARIERSRAEAKHRAEQLEPVRKRVHEKPRRERYVEVDGYEFPGDDDGV